MTTTTAHKALLLRSLHDPRRPLALSNVWDVGSALVAQAAGARALATTSAGVAWSLGVRDGDHLDRTRAVAVVAAVAAAVSVPVSADIEGGYADEPDGVERTVAEVIGAGAVGINIEDGARSPEDAAARIAAARRAADAAGVPLFVNARTDVYLAGIGAPEGRLAETLARAARYVEAGADGVFVPGVVDGGTIAALADGIAAPVNVLAEPGAPSVGELGRLGVARVSLGSCVVRAAYAVVQRATHELAGSGTYAAVADAFGYGELDGLMAVPAGDHPEV